jgi:hypothetical protein
MFKPLIHRIALAVGRFLWGAIEIAHRVFEWSEDPEAKAEREAEVDAVAKAITAALITSIAPSAPTERSIRLVPDSEPGPDDLLN